MKRIHQFILFLLFIPVFSHAQQEKTVPEERMTAAADSIRIADSIAALTDEDYGEDDTVHEKSSAAFDPAWMSAGDSVKFRHVSPATIKAQKADEEFWYANYPFKKKKIKEEDPGNTSRPLIDHPAFETILWVIVVAGFITFLVVFLMNGNAGIFRRSRSITTQGIGEENFEDIFAINYEQQIDKAAAEGNYNLGVRLLYLRLLRTLAERNIIDYKQDRTNFDYLLQLQPTRYYNDFFRLTRHYEYSWYGQFEMERGQFDQIRRQFGDFDRTIN